MLQRELAGRVVRRGSLPDLRTVAGVDVSVKGGEARAAVVVLAWPGMELVEQAVAVRPAEFPYVPGLLAFRELPVILNAYDLLATDPDCLLVDGHGLHHPRRFGVACMLGVVLDKPAIGCGKSRLCGTHREPGPRRGARTQVRHDGEVIGTCLRTRDGVRPVYPSIGHRVDLATATRTILAAARRTRLPEPIRAADRVAGLVPVGEG